MLKAHFHQNATTRRLLGRARDCIEGLEVDKQSLSDMVIELKEETSSSTRFFNRTALEFRNTSDAQRRTIKAQAMEIAHLREELELAHQAPSKHHTPCFCVLGAAKRLLTRSFHQMVFHLLGSLVKILSWPTGNSELTPRASLVH